MSTRTCWRAVSAVALAVVLGLLTVQASLALWFQVVGAGAGAVQAADFTVRVADPVSGGSGALGETRARPLPVQAAGGELDRGGTAFYRVDLSNLTDAGGSFDLRIRPDGPAAITPASAASALGDSLRLGLAAAGPVPCEAAAYAPLPVGTAAVGDLPSLTVGKGGTGGLCLRATLSPDAPADLSGLQAGVTLDLTALQVAGSEGEP
ncbi:hypothetical protein NBM05_11850 [Rothia sp. AR01]|uniref:Ribosomally synthesized peptide with SipW-like signal peptide n=1 Tax=Rothia santali TaxID=2949643 RepID=A0A9X2HJ56_9MICC|nr:hypothetical protein [Rothia santali]MCP3426676.1 hypothetical protein [Rothia santali]